MDGDGTYQERCTVCCRREVRLTESQERDLSLPESERNYSKRNNLEIIGRKAVIGFVFGINFFHVVSTRAGTSERRPVGTKRKRPQRSTQVSAFQISAAVSVEFPEPTPTLTVVFVTVSRRTTHGD